MLSGLAERWQFEFDAAIPRGSVSVVFRCRMADGRGAVLKVSPDRTRLVYEAAALGGWHTIHTPAVLALDEHGRSERVARCGFAVITPVIETPF